MYWLKTCPRCHGDLQEIDEVHDRYVACIQCGKVLTEAQEKALRSLSRQSAARVALGRAGRVAA